MLWAGSWYQTFTETKLIQTSVCRVCLHRCLHRSTMLAMGCYNFFVFCFVCLLCYNICPLSFPVSAKVCLCNANPSSTQEAVLQGKFFKDLSYYFLSSAQQDISREHSLFVTHRGCSDKRGLTIMTDWYLNLFDLHHRLMTQCHKYLNANIYKEAGKKCFHKLFQEFFNFVAKWFIFKHNPTST